MSFATFEESDLAALRAICGEARVTARDDVGEDFCHDELGGARGRPDARVRVKTTEEGYEGWIDNKQYTVLTSEEYEDLGRWEGVVEEPLMRIGDETGGLLVPMGSRLPERLGEHRAGAAESALKLLHAPYLWGGKSLMGIDCSGLVQVVYRVAGVNLPLLTNPPATISASRISRVSSR